MKEIKKEINQLLKLLDDMKKSYDEYTDYEVAQYIGKTFGTESEKYIELINEIVNKPTQNDIHVQDSVNKAKEKYSEDAEIIDGDYLNEMLKSSLTEPTSKQSRIFKINFAKNYKRIQNVIINLNKLLDKPIKKVQTVEEIQYKKTLSVREVELLYGFSKTQQQGFRARMRNSLPHHKQSTKSKSANTKIYYKQKELDDWIDSFL